VRLEEFVAGLRKILIVEDDPMIRDMYRTALVEKQYVVDIAGDSEIAYQKVRSFKPDVVFLDIMLPGVSGLEILKELRTNPIYNCQNVKIVILTNLAQNSVSENAIANGADGFIIKADILPKDLPTVVLSLEE
jgi:DNA-binding response OmpR family regulator